MKNAILIFAILFLTACVSDPTGPDKIDDTPTENPLEEAWALFTAGQYSDASDGFADVISDNPSNAEAAIGKGWSEYLMADSETVLQFLLFQYFSPQKNDPQFGNDAQLALASIYLIQQKYSDAIASANAVLSNDPQYEFQHKMDLDWRDLRLIKSQAHFLAGDNVAALSELQFVEPSLLGIIAGDPESWQYNDESYSILENLIAVLLQELTDFYS